MDDKQKTRIRKRWKELGMNYRLSFTSTEVTPWPGMVFLRQILDKTGFREQLFRVILYHRGDPIVAAMFRQFWSH